MSLNNPQTSCVRGRSHGGQTATSPTTYDLVCVGFGTNGLSVATSFADKRTTANILFFEKKAAFDWQPQHILPSEHVSSSFLRDLATTQNPRSEHTFVNYLHATEQLVMFTNNSQITPNRLVMGNYLQWVAKKIEERGWVSYGQEVIKVKPAKLDAKGRIIRWKVESRDANGVRSEIEAKGVLVAPGSQPIIPTELSDAESAPHIIHSSDCAPLLEALSCRNSPLDIAIVGAGQEAAELFEHLHSCSGQHRTSIFVPNTALRPAEHLALSLGNFDTVSSVLPPEVRERIQSGKKTEQTSKVHLRTIENIYQHQYEQKVLNPDESNHRHRMHFSREVVGAEMVDGKVRLQLRDTWNGNRTMSDRSFDTVIAATGYSFVEASRLIAPETQPEISPPTVNTDYSLSLRRDVVAPSSGIWLLGSLDSPGLPVDDFTCIAERAERTVQSILRSMQKAEKAEESYGAQPRL